MRFHYWTYGFQYVVVISGYDLLFFTNNMGDGLYLVDSHGNKEELLHPYKFSVDGLSYETAKRKLRKHLMSFINRGYDIYVNKE